MIRTVGEARLMDISPCLLPLRSTESPEKPVEGYLLITWGTNSCTPPLPERADFAELDAQKEGLNIALLGYKMAFSPLLLAEWDALGYATSSQFCLLR